MLDWVLLWFFIAGLLIMGVRRFFLGYPATPVGVQTLPAREYQTARAAALVIYPEGGAISASADSARVGLHADRFVGAQATSNQILMHLLFIAVEHATLVFPSHGPRGRRRFSSLDPDQQLAYLEGWRQSQLAPRRLVFMSLRAILTMGYFADPGVLRSLGLAPREIERRVVEADLLWPAVGEHPASIGFRQADVNGRGDLPPLGPAEPLHPDYR
ncbi:MAG: hypothetical protein P8R42_10890 [Candidatus Binatia bacterium]|nr:hypothetical protein [Candidatus Binatia bacterium]